ncbi:MAG: hypothetical protein IKZ44_10155 [Clostridia bacterium]|nr:hypothetical protein [Clostridia bacterium]
MKRKTVLTVVALIALFAALIYLAVLALAEFGILPQEQTENTMFVTGYLFLPLPLVGLLAGVLLQAYSVRSAKKKR